MLVPGLAGAAAVGSAALGRPWLALAAVVVGLLALQRVLLTPSRPPTQRTRRAVRGGAAGTARLARGAGSGVARGGRTVGAGVTRIARGALRLASAAVAAVAFYLVLTPIGLVSRLLGARLVATGAWYGRSPHGRTGDRRAFVRTDGGRGSVPMAGRHLSWRIAVALIAMGAVGATLLPRVVDRGPDESAVPEQLRGGFFNAFDSPALDDADWKDEAGGEFAAASGGQTYTSYVGNSLRDFEGRYVNVHDRQRRTYQPTAAAGTTPVVVWFFGGSTMFGFSAQRDLHTIPSEVVRLAERDGVAIEAHNFGSPGYVNMQETLLAAQLLASGQRPDLIVFYDGTNDTAVPFQQAFGDIGIPGDPSDIVAYSYRRLLAGQLTGTAEPPAPLAPVPELGRPPQAEAIIAALVDTYGRGIELATALGDQYGIPVVHFWQPDLFNKDELVAGEDVLLDRLGMDQFEYDAIARLSRAILPRLPGAAVDLSDAFDGVEEPLLTDQAHTNELGAHLVAEAMYAHLSGTLEELTADRG